MKGTIPPAAVAGLGKPKGALGGRARTLMLLDRILGEERCQREMERSLREAILEDPVKFFRTIVMPLLPQDVKIKLGEEGAIQWVSLSTMFPMRDKGPSTEREIDVSELSAAEDAGVKPSALPPNC